MTPPSPVGGVPAVGAPAPDLALRDQHGQTVSLADFRGHRAVLLVFYPWSFSRVCSSELSALRDDLPALEAAGVQVLAVSCDALFSQRVWSDQERFGFPLLTDHWPHGAAASAYGVFDAEAGCALRATFLVDRDGIVRWTQVHGLGEPRDPADHRAAVAALAAS